MKSALAMFAIGMSAMPCYADEARGNGTITVGVVDVPLMTIRDQDMPTFNSATPLPANQNKLNPVILPDCATVMNGNCK